MTDPAPLRIGVMGAMHQEVSLLKEQMSGVETEIRGQREYHRGTLCGLESCVVFSRIGKVASAATATTLIERYGVNLLLFTGVAGAAHPDLNVGDIILGESLVQHDMDASPLPAFRRFEIPLLGVSHFAGAPTLLDLAETAGRRFLDTEFGGPEQSPAYTEFGIRAPKLLRGLIASGDQFLADAEKVSVLRQALPGLLCIEMEGAAVAQVAHEHGIPCLVMRTVSDKADHSAGIDFLRFLDRAASRLTCGLVLSLLHSLAETPFRTSENPSC